MRKFSIIIPAYNEENRITPVLEEISQFIHTNRLPWEVIIAVDGNDGTEDIINTYNGKYPFIHLNKASGRNGMGGAIKRGILASTGDCLILMDADGSATLQSMVRELSLIDNYDIINFNRYASVGNKIPFTRRVASRSFNVLLRVLFGIHVHDTQCGYKIMKRSAIMPSVKRFTVSNAFFLTALFLYAKRNGVNVTELPIKYDHSDGSKFNVFMTSLSYIVSIVAFKIQNSKYYAYTPVFLKKLYYRKFRYL